MIKPISKQNSMDSTLSLPRIRRWNILLNLVMALSLPMSQTGQASDQLNTNALQSNQAKELIKQGEGLREKGYLVEAQKLFDQVLTKYGTPDNANYIAALTVSGYNQFLLNNFDLAEQQLKNAYEQSAKTSPYLHILSSEYLASLYLSQGADDLALSYFNEAYEQAKNKGYPELAISIVLLKSALEKTDPDVFIDPIAVLPEGYTKARLQLQSAEYILDHGLTGPTEPEQSKWLSIAYHAITDALRVAEANKQIRFQAELSTALVHLYYQQERYEDALILADKALVLAADSEATELTVKLNQLKGECYKEQGNIAAALQAYALAVEALDLIKTDMPINLPNKKSSVDVMIDPVYRGYADLVMQSPDIAEKTTGQNKILTAIQSMEAVKRADLEDFMLNRCSVNPGRHTDWSKKSFPEAAMLYPIIFNDRLELILKNGDMIYHHTVKVPKSELKRQVKLLIFGLQHNKNYQSPAEQLYQWLYAPISHELEQLKIKTLVFLPDRSLRAMPLSALFDGKQFVVEKQAIVTLPSLELENIYRQNPARKLGQTLIAGISKPDGPAIDSLPKSITDSLLGTNTDNEKNTSSEQSKSAKRLKLIDALSLPGVEKEVADISNLTKTQPLLNKNFTAEIFKTDLESAQYTNIHIASHGYFGKNIKDSFLMTYDQNLSLQDFEKSLKSEKLKKDPIDLLTLSACETAQGNDRMLLGFSGLAVKSNALSAVGSLWSINDDAAMQFMKNFYSGLYQSLSKAQAMRQAQIAMIKSKEYSHPFYWSPFVLIGNWQ